MWDEKMLQLVKVFFTIQKILIYLKSFKLSRATIYCDKLTTWDGNFKFKIENVQGAEEGEGRWYHTVFTHGFSQEFRVSLLINVIE